MQVTQTLSQGLRREYDVLVPAGDLASKRDLQLADLKNKVRINGFRPGKVPVAHLQRVYGRAVMNDVVQETIEAANRQIIDDNQLRLAVRPKIELPTEQAAIEAALEARGDLNFKIAVEVLPQIEVGEFSDIALEKLVADVEESDVDQALDRMVASRRAYSARAEGEAAEAGDRLTVDFAGTIDGEPFEGGTSEGVQVLLGSKTFIPGFEEALIGAVAGERRPVKATFPENYAMRALAGKTADFDVTVKSVEKPEPFAVDDDFAKSLGVESLEELRKGLRDRLGADLARASREKIKRKLLDALAARYVFELPQGLVDQEFDQIWAAVEKEQKSTGKTFEEEGKTEDAVRAEYRGIAERRVRLGLLLAEIASKADLKITEQEMTEALLARVRSFPGQEKEVWEHYRGNSNALAELRAPIYEEKAVDYILELANVAERKVGISELLASDDDETAPAPLEA
jgi:trigger factor